MVRYWLGGMATALWVVAVGAQVESARPISYADDVHPLLAARCYKCHAGDERRGGLSMNSREELLAGGESGLAVVSGESAESLLIELVSSMDPDERMPNKGDALTSDEIGLLRAWIDEGLVWDGAVTADNTWDAPITPRRPALPDGEGVSGSRHPVDRFVGAYWREHDVADTTTVSDAVFARRAYLDVTGLLPTATALAAFESDASEDKRGQLITSLLESDRDYAEHWMTFWNDALRNDFQGTGYIDGGRKSISQWLYDALYYNKAYDQFVRELIHPSTGSRGFVDGIVWRGVTAAAQQPPLQAARSVSQVFLGVNLKCASCHDSFIDEWKLADSYGLANCFSESPLELVRCDIPTGRVAETKFLWPELGSIPGDVPRGVRMRRLAEIVTSDENGRFARTMVNRLWAKLMGRGLVKQLDGMGQRPWHPDLLDWLASEFVAMDYDLRALIGLIMSSETYQLASVPASDEDYVFRGPAPKRLSAEQFYDAISRVSGHWQHEPKFSPPREHPIAKDVGVRAWRMPSDALTRALGRPNREQVVTKRVEEFTTLQALEMTNGETLSSFLDRAAETLHESLPFLTGARIDVVYRRALQRRPSTDELALGTSLLTDHPGAPGLADLLWSIAMLPEFQLIY